MDGGLVFRFAVGDRKDGLTVSAVADHHVELIIFQDHVTLGGIGQVTIGSHPCEQFPGGIKQLPGGFKVKLSHLEPVVPLPSAIIAPGINAQDATVLFIVFSSWLGSPDPLHSMYGIHNPMWTSTLR